MGKVYTLRRQQSIPVSMEKAWDFISSPANLKKITPQYMGFDITSPELPGKMYAGMIITYIVTPVAGIRVNWVTEITHIEEGKYFIDEQRSGPYAFWHHQHFIEPDGDGVIMTDILTYRPPFGILGRISNLLFIRSRLNEIFDYRNRVLSEWADPSHQI